MRFVSRTRSFSRRRRARTAVVTAQHPAGRRPAQRARDAQARPRSRRARPTCRRGLHPSGNGGHDRHRRRGTGGDTWRAAAGRDKPGAQAGSRAGGRGRPGAGTSRLGSARVGWAWGRCRSRGDHLGPLALARSGQAAPRGSCEGRRAAAAVSRATRQRDGGGGAWPRWRRPLAPPRLGRVLLPCHGLRERGDKCPALGLGGRGGSRACGARNALLRE